MRVSFRFLALGAFLLGLLAEPVSAGVWNVGRNPEDCDPPCNFHDDSPGAEAGGGVERAMSSPSVIPGDSVRVWPGTYPIKFAMKSGVTLFSKDGPEITTLGTASSQEPLILMSACNAATVIDGFTIVWDSQTTGTGGCIAAYVSDAVVKNNIFRDSQASFGTGIYMQFCDLLVENNLFLNNFCATGGGVVAVTGGAPVVRNNTFYGSDAPFGFEGAAFFASGSAPVFEKNIVMNSTGGTSVFCVGSVGGQVSCNLFHDNPLGATGGTCVDSTGASGNFNADPLFCNVVGSDFGVCLDSPALTGACGVIGYTPPTGTCPNCGPVSAGAGVETVSWGRVKAQFRHPAGR